MLDDFLKLADDKIKKSVDVLKNEFSKIAINKVNINLIRSLSIIFNNEKLFLDQISVISIESGNVVFIKPFDKRYISLICNALIKLNIDLNPFVITDSIKLVFPIFTMERRQFFWKKAKKMSDDIKISIRNIRKSVYHDVNIFLKNNKISADEEKKFSVKLQKMIDSYIVYIDSITKKKEKELLNV